jgi:hypothetical protein
MERLQRYLIRGLFNSTFGVTLLTMAAMILILGFLIRGTHPVNNFDAEPSDDFAQVANNDQSPASETIRTKANERAAPAAPASSARVKPSERYAMNRGSATPQVAPGYVARLTRTCDCRWAKDAEAPRDGAQLRVGQTLNVATGLAEIAFACGAKAILEGPAVLELQSAKSSALHTGRLTADVPDEVEGFTVHTPVAQVVSLCALETKPVARLTSIADCRWANGTAATKQGSALKSGQSLKLAEGLAEITFACGAKVILQGPAVLEIESAKTAILHSGKLTADVPDDLEGFKIRTAVVEVISLPTDPKVAKGKDVSKSTKPSVSAAQPDAEPGVVILKAGEHAQIEAPAKGSGEKVRPPAKRVPAKS